MTHLPAALFSSFFSLFAFKKDRKNKSMFGRQQQQQPKSKQASKEFDLDELLNSTLKDVDDDLEMNDPELLVIKSKNIEIQCILLT